MKKRLLALALSLTMLFSLSACGNKAEDGAKGNLKDVTFVLDWTPNTNHTGLYVAQEKGYFAEEGLNVKLIQPPEDGSATLVAAGGADFGIGYQDTIAPAWAKKDPLPVTAIAAVLQHNTSGILTPAERLVQRPKDLEGKTYATWDSPIEKAMLKYVVEKDGGDFSKVKLVPATVTDEPSAMRSGQVDALWVYYAAGGVACEVQKVPTNYFDFISFGPVFDYYTPMLIASNRLLEEDPELVKAFLRATSKGYTFAAEHPKEAADILLKLNPELDREYIEKSQEWLSPYYIAEAKKWGVFDRDRWNAFYQWLNEEKLIEMPIADDFGFTNAYLEE